MTGDSLSAQLEAGPMPLTRAELQVHLDHLESAVDGLLASAGDHFIAAFAGMADAIADSAAAGPDTCWVEDQAIAILERRGLVERAPEEA